MSNSVDQRLVDLKINYKEFVTGIKAAITSLNTLKKNMNMDKAANEFNKVEKAAKEVNFNDMYNAVNTIESRFSTFGIVAISALNNITNTAVNAGKRLLSALTAPLIEGGKRRALNIEQAKFQIQGLGYTWEQVEDDINYGVKDTAYGLDAAAKAASQLLASQVKVGEEMKASLRGISGVAAMTSSEYEDIANIFTTVAGNGRLMGDQLMQLSSRGLNAAATLGQYLGKSEAEIREMTSKGKIDFATFAAAMDSAFGEHAKKANETFTGSLSNMKAALSRIGANFATPAYENLRDVFNSLTPVIDGVKDALDPLVKLATQGMVVLRTLVQNILPKTRKEMADNLEQPLSYVTRTFAAFGKIISNIASFISSILTPIFKNFGDFLGINFLRTLANTAELFARFTESLKLSDKMSSNLKTTFRAIFMILSDLFSIITKLVSIVTGTLFKAFVNVFGFVADILLTITSYLGKIIVTIRNTIISISKLKVVRDTFKAIESVFGGLFGIISKVFNKVRELSIAFLDGAFQIALKIFEKLALAIYNVARFIDRVVTAIRQFIDTVSNLPAVKKLIETVTNGFNKLKQAVQGAGSTFKTKFLSVFQGSIQSIVNFVKRLKELIEQYVKLPSFTEVVVSVQEFVLNIFEKTAEMLLSAKEVFGQFIDKIKELDGISFSGILNNLKRVRDAIMDFLDIPGKIEAIKNGFFALKDGSAAALDATGNVLDSFKKTFTTFIEWLKGKFGQLNMSDVLAAGIGGTFIAFLIQLTKFTSQATKLTEGLTKVVGFVKKLGESINGVFDSIAKIGNAKAQAIKMEALTGVIKSMVLLAGALAVLANVNQDNLRNSAIILGALSAAMIGLVVAITSLMKSVKPTVIAEAATVLMAVSGSILVLVAALKLLSTISLDGIVERILALGAVMAEFAVLMLVLSKLKAEVVTGSASIISISISIMLLANALQRMGTIGTENLASSTIVLITMMGLLGLIGKAASKATMTWQAAVSIVAMTTFLVIMMGAIKKLADIDAKTMQSGITRLIEIMAVMALFFKATQLAGKYAKEAGASVIAISAAMVIMTVALRKMAEIDPGMLSQATRSLVVILGIFALLTASTLFAGKNAHKAGAAILMMSAAMIVLAGAMLIIGKMRPEEVDQATEAVTKIMMMFALIVAATSVARKSQQVIKTIAIAVAGLAAAIAVLALIDPNNLDHATLALSMVMGMFALVVASTSLAKKAYGAIAIMVAVVGALTSFLILLAALAPDKALESAEALSILLLSLSASLLILQGFRKEMFVNVIAGIGAFAALIVAIGGLMVALGALTTYIPEVEEFLNKGIPVLEAIGKGIGSFIGGIVGSIVSSSSAGFVELGSNLSQFMENLQPFIEYVKTIDNSAMGGIDTIVRMVLALTAASFIDGLNLFGSVKDTIKGVADGLPELAEGFKSFASSLEGMESENVVQASKAIKSIMDILSKIPPSGGLLSLLLGGQDLQGMANNLPKLAGGLKAFASEVSGMDTGSVENTKQACQIIIELAGSLPSTYGGLVSVFAGGTFIDDFSNQIPLLGSGLKAFSENIAGMDTGSVENTKQACQIIIELAGSLPNTYGGLVSVFSGGTFIDDFSNQMPILANAFFMYAQNIAGMDTSSVENTKSACEIIIQLASALPQTYDGLLSVFTGGTFIDDFAKQMPILAHAFFMYAQNIAGMDTGSVENTETACRSIIDLTKYISESSGFFESITRDISMVDLSANLPLMAHAFFMYAQNIAGMDTGSVMNTIDPIRSIIDITRYISESAGFIEGLSRDISMVDLSANLPLLAHAFFMYAQNIGGMDTGSVENTRPAIYSIFSIVGTASNSLSIIATLSAQVGLFNVLPTLAHAFFMYAQNIGGMDTGSVFNTNTAILAIVDTMNLVSGSSLVNPEIISSITTNLPKVGQSIKTYYDYVSGVDAGVIASSITAIQQLGNAMTSFPTGIDFSSLTTFVNAIKTAGSDAVNQFVSALNSGGSAASAAMTNMVTSALNSGIIIVNAFNIKFKIEGEKLIKQLILGMESESRRIPIAITNQLTAVVISLRNYGPSFVSLGVYYVKGIISGVNDQARYLYDACYRLGRKMVERTEKALDEHSPSKEGSRIGRFWDEGIRVGVIKYAYRVLDAVSDTSESMKDEMYDMFGIDYLGDLNLSPTITPIIDASKIDKGIDDINSSLQLASGISLNIQNAQLSAAFSNLKAKELEIANNQNRIPENVNYNYDFTQNNYSPKALSRLDIYRQTNNQISRLQKVVNT